MDDIVTDLAYGATKEFVAARGFDTGDNSAFAAGVSAAITVGWIVFVFVAWRVGIYVFTKTARVVYDQMLCLVGTVVFTSTIVFLGTYYGMQ